MIFKIYLESDVLSHPDLNFTQKYWKNILQKLAVFRFYYDVTGSFSRVP